MKIPGIRKLQAETRLNISVISIDSVLRPAHVVEYSEFGNSWLYTNTTIPLETLVDRTYFSVPYLYAKRDALAYDESFQHWRYGAGNKNASSTDSDRSSNQRESSRFEHNFDFDISERVYPAFLNGHQIDEIDAYLKNRYSEMQHSDKDELEGYAWYELNDQIAELNHQYHTDEAWDEEEM